MRLQLEAESRGRPFLLSCKAPQRVLAATSGKEGGAAVLLRRGSVQPPSRTCKLRHSK